MLGLGVHKGRCMSPGGCLRELGQFLPSRSSVLGLLTRVCSRCHESVAKSRSRLVAGVEVRVSRKWIHCTWWVQSPAVIPTTLLHIRVSITALIRHVRLPASAFTAPAFTA